MTPEDRRHAAQEWLAKADQTLADAGDQLLERIGVVAELLAELAVEALRRARIMDIFVRERAGVMIVRAKRAALR